MIRKARAEGEGPYQFPVYAETLDGHRFEIYEDSHSRLRLHVDGKLERQYVGVAARYDKIYEDLVSEWEVEPTDSLWPGK